MGYVGHKRNASPVCVGPHEWVWSSEPQTSGLLIARIADAFQKPVPGTPNYNLSKPAVKDFSQNKQSCLLAFLFRDKVLLLLLSSSTEDLLEIYCSNVRLIRNWFDARARSAHRNRIQQHDIIQGRIMCQKSFCVEYFLPLNIKSRF